MTRTPTGPAWQAFFDELARWRDGGRTVRFWWRDDDAQRPDPALQQLVAQSRRHAVPLALAVIPQALQPGMLDAAEPLLNILQHGVDHRSRALEGQKKTEFPPQEAVAQAQARLAQGWVALQRLQAALPTLRILPVLVPPWNRLASTALLPRLPGAGYRGISRFGARQARLAAPGLVQANTHVDIIDWRGSRGFAGEDAVLAQAVAHLQALRVGRADADEATGWLTHHAVHDAASWAFMDQLLDATRQREGVAWVPAESLFDCPGEQP